MLPLLAGSPRLLRRQHHQRRHFRPNEMHACSRGLLRVFASQEGGEITFIPKSAIKVPENTEIHTLGNPLREWSFESESVN